ncbi:hypothetical protein D3C73_1112940 [compost metagenome]
MVLHREQFLRLLRDRQRAHRFRGGVHGMRVVQADQRGQHQADGQQQLEHRRAATAPLGAEHFGQVQRDDHADQATADTLQQAPQQQRGVARRKRHDRDAGGEQDAGQQHRTATADEVGDHAGEQRGQHAAQQHRGDDETELLAAELPGVAGGGFKVRQGAGDDADVDAVQQAAEAADEQQVAYGPARGGGSGYGRCSGCGHRRIPGITGMVRG